MHTEDSQIREIYKQEALMAGDEQVDEEQEAGDQANSTGSEGEAYDLTNEIEIDAEIEAEVKVEPGSEEEIERQVMQGTETSKANDMINFL
jgi:hypothetical protein